jgi:hypothetical protein
MKRTHLLSTAAALGAALFAAPAAFAQRGGAADMPASSSGTAQNRATAEADRMHKGDGTGGGPAELLRMAQSALRRGQAAQANELLERAETRLLLRAGTGEAGRPAQGEPAQHVAEARRALASRDRAEAMRHTNLAIATTRDNGIAAATGSDGGGRRSAQGGGSAGGAVDLGMGTFPGGSGCGTAVVRDGGTGGTSVSRAEGMVLAQTGGGGGGRGGSTALPPGDTIPGWSGPRGGTAPGARGGTAATPQGGTTPQDSLVADPALGGNLRGGGMVSGAPNTTSGPSSSSMTGGEPARVGGSPPGDTLRSPGSSGVGGAGVGSSGVGGPIR